ncbi:hypothetical protein HN748_00110 [Candidatus Peregrinibacteria bacterium]|jgi:hypothetical protein|nr:hypothetical protein [Candidatus Peregrinibacteria bacterium]MBT7483290.1 hypothetical protein [Candidatus Peregrinibacteria bacterium]MBT7702615.1 hypothetical protein [Candidatus Peregrinibacteria bacterium]
MTTPKSEQHGIRSTSKRVRAMEQRPVERVLNTVLFELLVEDSTAAVLGSRCRELAEEADYRGLMEEIFKHAVGLLEEELDYDFGRPMNGEWKGNELWDDRIQFAAGNLIVLQKQCVSALYANDQRTQGMSLEAVVYALRGTVEDLAIDFREQKDGIRDRLEGAFKGQADQEVNIFTRDAGERMKEVLAELEGSGGVCYWPENATEFDDVQNVKPYVVLGLDPVDDKEPEFDLGHLGDPDEDGLRGDRYWVFADQTPTLYVVGRWQDLVENRVNSAPQN